MSNWAGAGGAGCWHGLTFFYLVLVYIIDFQVFLSFLVCFFAWFAFAKLLQGCAKMLQRRKIILIKS